MSGKIEVSHRPAIGDLLPLGQVQQIDDRPAFALAAQRWQIVYLLPIHFAFVRKKQKVGVRAGHEQVFDRVLFFRLSPANALAAATLRPVDADRRPLDVPAMADRHDHVLFGDQIRQVNVTDLFAADLGPPVAAVLSLDLTQIVLDDVPDVLFVGQDPQVLGNLVQ